MKCPHCGNETSAYRLSILDLADGTKTIAEIADLLNKDHKALRATINVMRNEGHEMKFKDASPYDKNALREREIFVIKQTINGVTVRELADKLGVSSSRIGQIRDKALRVMRRENPEVFQRYQEWMANKNKDKSLKKFA
jgi:DNA-directed RNA polymerase sigma subunit (sigma70/sigma32)